MELLRATSMQPAGAWDASAELDRIAIDYDLRHRRRILLRTQRGRELLLDLPRAVQLRHDDGLVLEDGRIIRVLAKPELVHRFVSTDPHILLRLNWHLGNRHLPVQIERDALVIRADHVIADMAAGLGAEVAIIEAPFDPEPGAYAGGHHHHHG